MAEFLSVDQVPDLNLGGFKIQEKIYEFAPSAIGDPKTGASFQQFFFKLACLP